MRPQHETEIQRLSDMLSKLHAGSLDPQHSAQLSQLACVQLSGILEVLIRQSLGEYTKKRSSPQVTAFALKQLERFQNPNPEKILQLFESFDREWKVQIEEFWSDEIKDAIGSIVANRHLIAHGRPSDVSVVRVRDWLKCTQRFAEFIKKNVLVLNL